MIHTQRNLNYIHSEFCMRDTKDRKAVGWHIQSAEREKLSTKYVVYKATLFWNESEIKSFSEEQRLREFIDSRSDWQKILKESF
jgi:hypothetical protein